MKAQQLICPGVRQIEVEEFELRPLPDDGILVQNQVTAVSIGTELWGWMYGGRPDQTDFFPRTTGYCNTGVVLEVGKEITDVKPGDRVASRGNHASHYIGQKSKYKGLYHRVPEGVDPKSAVFLNLAAIAMHGARVAKVELGEAVVITGMGIVGQLALTLVQLNGGMPIIAVDLDDFRLGVAKEQGVDVCLNPAKIEDMTAAVREHCVEDGANVVIEATGKPAAYPMAIKLACLGGRFVALGSPRGTVEFSFLEDVHLREVKMLGAIQPRTPDQDHIYYRWTKDRDRTLLLQLMADGKLLPENLVTHVFKPEQCQDVYNMLADRAQEEKVLGVLFDWQDV
ncbi:MAG: zinc-binding alcohol dehydrogenase [Candidatus Latescibacteria bacterium]|jgi:2-desacetyl-2-hydroxyethyl bacteriochlorophyllide A dehydrogenase|nr:zinc-binding alcohol dehydrogenase [Candidatus Latescibacterota bacterium]